MATELYVWALALLLPGWAMLIAPPFRPAGGAVPSPPQLGYLRRGPGAAIRTAVVDLHSGGLVEVAGRGVIARSRAPMRSGGEPLARAVYAAMPTPSGVRMLRGRSRVRAALAELTGQLASAGLVPGRLRWLAARAVLLAMAGVSVVGLQSGPPPASLPWLVAGLVAAGGLWLVPRRTVAGRRELARCRRQRAGAAAGEDTDAAGYALRGSVPPALVRAFARQRPRRGAGDHPSAYDHRGVGHRVVGSRRSVSPGSHRPAPGSSG